MTHHFRTYYHTLIIGILASLTGWSRTETVRASSPKTSEQALYEKYIRTYYKIAIRKQVRYSIPASITLAQGLLESGAGESYLALAGNNHFGIKSNDWKGVCIYKDDDGKQEGFRKYLTAEESFEDHARFLTERSHYKSLFKLKTTDYKGWAHGLKRCGYATDPDYAVKLIALIEKYGLYYFDTASENAPPITGRQSISANVKKEAKASAWGKKKAAVTNKKKSSRKRLSKTNK